MEEPWWKKWGGLTRGCFLQLIMLMKNGDDTGVYVAHSYTKLSNDMSIDRRTARDQCTIMSRDSGLVMYKNAQGQLILYHPKYRFYQDLNAKTHAEYIKTRGQKSGENVPLLDQSILDQSILKEETPVFSKPKEEWEQNLSPIQQDFLEWEQAEFEMTILPKMSSFYGALKDLQELPGWKGGVAFVRDYEQELRSKVMTTPDYFKDHKPWKDELTRFIKVGIEAGRLGNAGMKGMSASEEHAHEERKEQRTGSQTFDNGIKGC